MHEESRYKDEVSSDKEMDDTDKAFEVSTFSNIFLLDLVKNTHKN